MAMARPGGVLAACERVAAEATWVGIDAAAVAALATRIAAEPVPPGAGAWPPPHLGTGDAPPERVAGWTLQLSAMNFCFWQDEPRWRAGGRDGYLALATALRRGHDDGAAIGDAAADARRSVAELATVLRGDPGGPAAPPMLAERHACSVALARWVVDRHAGSALAALTEAGDAVDLAVTLAAAVPCFRDVAQYRGRVIPLLKRAQIAAFDCGLALGEMAPAGLRRRAGLTAFADYKLPQLLRDAGVLVYAPALAATVDARRELPPGAEEETEIRASTVVAVERLRLALAAHGLHLDAAGVDSLLWWRAQDSPPRRPYHRTRTIWY